MSPAHCDGPSRALVSRTIKTTPACEANPAALLPPTSNPQGRKAGLRVFGSARAELRGCVVERCGGPGLLLQERGAAVLDGCTLRGCGAEGLAASGDVSAELRRCAFASCAGPAVDASGAASVGLAACELGGCVGGLWLWDGARCHASEGTHVGGGGSFAVLLGDETAAATSDGSATLEGPVLAAGALSSAQASGRKGATGERASMGGAGAAADAPGPKPLVARPQAASLTPADARAAGAAFPPEVEPFVFVPPAVTPL
jgi:hypothetical protein